MKLISILIPTRNRFDSLLQAIDSIVSNASDPSRIEIILRFDEDDPSVSRLTELPDTIDIHTTIGHKYGYERLHEYVNEMCATTTGEFILWFNDDCIIDTPNWDDCVAKHSGKIVCLYPDNKGTGSGNIFPLVSRRVYEILGYWAKSQQVDSWMSYVCRRAGIEIRANDLVMIHNREQAYVSDTNRAGVLNRTRAIWRCSEKARCIAAKKLREAINAA